MTIEEFDKKMAEGKHLLHPCPFCGGGAEMKKNILHWVQCSCGGTGPLEATYQKALEVWNARV